MKTGIFRVWMAAALLAAPTLAIGAEGMSETEVEAQVENGPLAGTLTLPKGAPRAAMVIIPGSGPTDRDGDSPMGVRAGYLRMLAEALAGHGVASIRIDKRGMFGSAGSFPDANAVTFDEYAGDALAWARVAREKAGTGCVWLLGHSEGGLVALVAASRQAGAELCGLVLVAAPGRRMGDVMRAQLRANPANAPVLDDALAAIDTLERGEKVDVSTFHPALRPLFDPSVQDFLIDGFARDPAALAAGIDLPVLIVQGDNDLQVGTADAEALSQAQPAAELLLVPGMNHVLKLAPPGDAAANLAAYANPQLPLASGVADAIAAFVSRER